MWLGTVARPGLGQDGEILHRVEGPGKATFAMLLKLGYMQNNMSKRAGKTSKRPNNIHKHDLTQFRFPENN